MVSFISRLRRRLTDEIDSFRAAMALLTRIPVAERSERTWPGIEASAVYFPWVGLLVGGIGWIAAIGAGCFLSAGIASLACVVAMVAVTGAMHEDGLADATDGLLGARAHERRLALMKEGSIGVYGMIALWCVLSARFLGIRELMSQGPWRLFGFLLVTQTVARSVWLILLNRLPYLRHDGAKFSQGGPVTAARVCVGLAVPVLCVLSVLGPLKGAACLLLVSAMSAWLIRFFRKELGGVTGDCLGAASQCVEMVCYLPFLVGIRGVLGEGVEDAL